MVPCPEHPKRDQNLKFTPLSETTCIPTPVIWQSQSPTPPSPQGDTTFNIIASLIAYSVFHKRCQECSNKKRQLMGLILMRFESTENVSLFFMSENYKSQGCVHQKSFTWDANMCRYPSPSSSTSLLFIHGKNNQVK